MTNPTTTPARTTPAPTTTARRRTRRTPVAALASGLAASGLVASAVLAPIAASADPGDDTTAPISTVHRGTPPASGWYTSASVPARITASDAGAGVASISYAINGGAPVTVARDDVSIALVDEGTTTLTVWATDAAGNVEEPHDSVFRIDRSAPTVEVVAPTLVERGAAVLFQYLCADAASYVVSCSAPIAAGTPLPTDELGEHTIDVTATDAAGFTTTTTHRYLVAPDLTAPEVSLAIAPTPANGWHTMPLGIGIVASDASGIASRHWWTDGAVSMNGDVTREEEDAVFTLDFDGVTDISFWAYDVHGNRSDGRHRVQLDTVAPTVAVGGALPELAAPATPSYRQGEVATIRAVCDDVTSGVAECGILESPSGVVPTGALGDHSLTLYAVDVAGHRTELAYDYRVVAAPAGGGATAGGQAGGQTRGQTGGQAGGQTGELAATGADPGGLAGLVMLGGLLMGAGVAALGLRRIATS
ncbi:hypothetical protein H4J02_05395 [Protaetiibacter sp. SSC-01]|uniref:OmpL47-type beta-barrel domain-containing protein n=1 Tax=Protaetiibacter sp. SSC-01 TaxID=2759943 RepID=UPI001656EEA0|nr:hypothetical protein [Protaetiibacter sp. SSC-01]QNO38440.1 hypothetical protein H4J02_05395 [Protaetiibacter sp. SSC-01]